MELGDEVSIKIKSAIRAKLKELGIVWDRELPDYVMVLIANKKSKEQMEQDLMIFLGSHTAGFTTWLHNVLRKLEECTVSRGLTKKKEEEKKQKPKRKPSDENHQESKKLKSIDVKLENSPDPRGSDDEGNQLSAVRIEEGLDSDVSDKSVPIMPKSDRKINSSVNFSQLRANGKIDGSARTSLSVQRNGLYNDEKTKHKEKIEINWNDEKIDYEKEFMSIGRREASSQKKFGTRMKNQMTPRRSKSRSRSLNKMNHEERRRSSVAERGMKENLRRDEEYQDYRESRNFSGRDSEENRNGYKSDSRNEKKSRDKNRNAGPRHQSHEGGERLPSLVKVTPRPIRPPNMQAPSNLILKAVAEAQKSIATSSLPQPDEKEKRRKKSREGKGGNKKKISSHEKLKVRVVKKLPVQENPLSHFHGAKALNTSYKYLLQEKNISEESLRTLKCLRDAAVRKAKFSILGRK